MPLDTVREAEVLGRILLERRRITPEQLEAARAEAAGRGGRLATVLYALGAIDLAALSRALAEVHGVDAVLPERVAVLERKVVSLLPPRVCLRAFALPVRLWEEGIDVAFADPADESAMRDVEKSAPRPVRVQVIAEPLLWYAFRTHGIGDKPPRAVAPLVDELIASGLSSAPKATPRGDASRAPVPGAADEFHTTPLGGVAPHLPDEVSTAGLGRPSATVRSPEEILDGDEGAFSAAEARLESATGLGAIAEALLAYARTGSPACAVLQRSGEAFEPVDAAGALEGRRFSLPADRPTVLTAALAGETGYRGAVPAGSASLALFDGRTPREILLLALSRRAGAEALLHVESGDERLDAAFVERLRVLARRVRATLE